MKIAVPYENDQVFQHFGHTEQFKVYEIEANHVVSSEIVPTNGSGHEALADFLSALSVNVLLCGGIGSGAQAALDSAGIEVCSGAAGDADIAVSDYLSGALESAGVNCDHHHEEEGCGSHCGGGCGVGMMIRGYDEAVAAMEVGQSVDIHLTPDQAYGYPDPRAVFTVEIAQMPGCENLQVGEDVVLSTNAGQPIPVKVTARDDTTITFDANHELAGKELNFHIELVEVR